MEPSLTDFLETHKQQLEHFDVPESLWSVLHKVRWGGVQFPAPVWKGGKSRGTHYINKQQLSLTLTPAALTREAGTTPDVDMPGSNLDMQKLVAGVHDLDLAVACSKQQAAVVAMQDIDALSEIWLVRHTLSAPTAWQLIAKLRQDLPCLMQVATDIQALSDEDTDSDDGAEDAMSSHTDNQPLDSSSSNICSAVSSYATLDAASLSATQGHGGTDLQSLDSSGPDTCVDILTSTSDTAFQQCSERKGTACDVPEQRTEQEAELWGSQGVPEQVDADGGVCGTVLQAVMRHLHRHVFMFEAQGVHPQGGNLRIRYMLDALVSRMEVAAQPHIQLCPFIYCASAKHQPQIPLACGSPVTRARLPLGLADYAQKAFWEESYKCETKCDEWYCDMTAELLAMLFKQLNTCSTVGNGQTLTTTTPLGIGIGSSKTVLVAGCGNSTLGVDLHRQGITNVINVDYVQEVVDMMEQHYPAASYPGLSWVQADLTNLHHQLPDGSIDVVVDKATLDAMHTSDASQAQRWGAVHLASRYLSEMRRVLKPDGFMLVISLRGPARFQELLETACTMTQQHDPHTHTGSVVQPTSSMWHNSEHLALPEAEAHAYVLRPIY